MSEETVEVTVKLPKGVVEWFSLFNSNLAEKLEEELVQLCESQIDNSDMLLTSEILMDQFKLKPVFQKYGLIK